MRRLEPIGRGTAHWLRAAILLAACGCSEVIVAPISGLSYVNREWVVGEAAQHLNADGQFDLAYSRLDEMTGKISADVAQAQGNAWLKAFGRLFQSTFSRDRGSTVDATRLRLCSRPYYAHSAYEEVDTIIPAPRRRPWGPHWLLTYCSPLAIPTVSLGVSVYNEDLGIIDGYPVFPRNSGGHFNWEGIPNHFIELPISPERAVAFAYRATGVRISSVPRLDGPPAPNPPYLAKWRMTLERPVLFTVEATGQSVETAEVWIGAFNSGSAEAVISVGGSSLDSLVGHVQRPDPVTLEPKGPVLVYVLRPRPGRSRWQTARVSR